MMLRLTAAAIGLAMLAGCQDAWRYKSMALGEVDMMAAMTGARDVLGQYFPIAEVDNYAHKITSEPKNVRGGSVGLISKGPARELAVLRLRRQGAVVWADVSVIVQHQEAPQRRMMAPWTSRQDVPTPTPAQADAPYTPEQEEAWQTVRHNEDAEAKILQDLYTALHPEASARKSEGASQPATQKANIE
jgi:hypothetical protein